MRSKDPAPRMPDLTLPPRFSASWGRWIDEILPSFVKRRYSPKPQWRDRPFEAKDVEFFSRGVLELSDRFTEGRAAGLGGYLDHERFRSSYLLYFLPLQAAKFLSLLELHPVAGEAIKKQASSPEGLRVLDLGSGPGTSSFALIHWLLAHGGPDWKISLTWVDQNARILKDGEELLATWAGEESRLSGRVELRTQVSDVWKIGPWIREPRDLTLIGNVLNEGTQMDSPFWPALFAGAQGAGILCLEPASKGSSQRLSRLRDRALEGEWIPAEPESFWGPCLHAGACPLSDGRDWCHFSVPVRIPGQWFRAFSEKLGSERQWAKFSYLWFASPEVRAPAAPPKLRRILSDPLQDRGQARKPTSSPVLICQPDAPLRLTVPAHAAAARGGLIEVGAPIR